MLFGSTTPRCSSPGCSSAQRVDNALEIVTYVAIGLLFGCAAGHRGGQDPRPDRGELAARGGVPQARGAGDPAHQRPGLHAVDPALDHQRRASPWAPTARSRPRTPPRSACSASRSSRWCRKPIAALFRDDGGLSQDVSQGALGSTAAHAARGHDGDGRRAGRSTSQASTSRMRAVGGAVLGAVVTLEDVSEVRALTEQLIRADRLAAMGELTAGVAHEVRNPLGVIRASVQLLEDAELRRAAHPRLGGGHQAGDRPARQGHQGAARLRPAQHADDDDGSTSPRSSDDVVLFTNRFATQSNVADRDGLRRRPARRDGRPRPAQAGVLEPDHQRRPGDGGARRYHHGIGEEKRRAIVEVTSRRQRTRHPRRGPAPRCSTRSSRSAPTGRGSG